MPHVFLIGRRRHGSADVNPILLVVVSTRVQINQAPKCIIQRVKLVQINQAPKCIIQRVKLEQSWRDTQAKTLSEAN